MSLMPGKPSDSTRSTQGGELRHKPLAGLSDLRARFPAAEPASHASEPASAAPELGRKLVVQRERKQRGGKTVTRVHGLEVDAPARAKLAQELARALGCGTSIEDGDILLQGAQVERVADWLERRGASSVIRGN